jgi:hypothetical protein
MRTSTNSFLAVCGLLILVSPSLAREKGVIEGYVRDEKGQPVERLELMVRYYVTQSDTLVVPIVGKNTVGAIGVKFPEGEQVKELHFAKTDKEGHYSFRVPAQTYWITITANKQGYAMPPTSVMYRGDSVEVQEGQKTTHDIRVLCCHPKDLWAR